MSPEPTHIDNAIATSLVWLLPTLLCGVMLEQIVPIEAIWSMING